ncbi:ABC-2 transporter [Hamiltosporidium magnivora]|uniref:ABC-2 transporter n=1 Tax=Hamiltosporidium magnivora TaxID=148818 RepID=A0A4Q9LEZ8_9MICR|nr:ABC-2 transporter [Hamiltosporidium magnivora]
MNYNCTGDIHFENILTKIKDKNILKSITGKLCANRMTAIMGSSGCGKTTLLKILSGRFNKKYDGCVYLDGVVADKKILCGVTAFVHQDDVLQTYSTVKESVKFACEIQGRRCDVDEHLSCLGLYKIKDQLIGTPMKGGISGGERKRLSIAMELIRDPQIIFLDEPTSGLDCLTASKLMGVLRDLSCKKTVVASIHQPSSDIFYSFDDLLVLKDGLVVYYGEVKNLVSFMENQGFPCPAYTNPADFLFTTFLPAFSVENNSEIPNNAQKTEKNVEIISVRQITEKIENKNFSKKIKFKSERREPLREFKMLFIREMVYLYRNKLLGIVKIAQSLFTVIIVGSIFYNIGGKDINTQIKNTCGVLYFLAINLFFTASFTSLQLFFVDYDNLVREYQSGYFCFSSYFEAKILANTLIAVSHPLVMVPLLWFLIKIEYSFVMYVFLMTASIFTSLVGQSVGILTASISSTLNIASAILPSAMLPLSLLNGMLVDPDNIFFIFKILQYISPTRHTFNILVKNSFDAGKIEDVNIKRLCTDFLSKMESIFMLFALYLINILVSFYFMQRKVRKSC